MTLRARRKKPHLLHTKTLDKISFQLTSLSIKRKMQSMINEVYHHAPKKNHKKDRRSRQPTQGNKSIDVNREIDPSYNAAHKTCETNSSLHGPVMRSAAE